MELCKRHVLTISLGEEILFDDIIPLIFQYFDRPANYLIFYLMANVREMTPKLLKTDRWIIEYNNIQFFHLFRMGKETFNKLVNYVSETDKQKVLSKPYTGGHYPVNIYGHTLIFLWYMATQDTLLSIGTRFKVSPSTVMDVVNKMLYFLLKLKNRFIQFPKCEQELIDVSNGFKNYPGVIGAIDGTHIFVKVEEEQQDSYIDRYRRNSINLMAICDFSTLFTYVFVGFPGSAHDSRVFDNSLFHRNINRFGANYYFKDDQKYHLVGDSAFALKKWLMTPYRGDNLSRMQKHHNYCLSSARVKIEHAFGGYKGRWRRVQYINTYNICKAIEIATVACILHNFCILNGEPWDDNFYQIHNWDYQMADGNPGRDNIEGRLKRDRIAFDLYNR